jgi:replicative superfamily II helicase
MEIYCINLEDLAEWELAENMTNLILQWRDGPSVKEILSVLPEEWRHQTRLTMKKETDEKILHLCRSKSLPVS